MSDGIRNGTRMIFCCLACCGALLAASTPAWSGGRPEGETRNWFPHFSGGYAFAESDTSDFLDDSWTISGGATYWPVDWPAGISLSLSYSDFDLSDKAVRAVNDAIQGDPLDSGRIDGGFVKSWAATINGIWGPGRRDNGFYLTGGIGVYYLKGAVTQDSLVYYPPSCDPWYWWWCFPGGVGPGSIVKADDTTTEFGWNVGLGYSFEIGRGQLFVEAKYHSVDTKNNDLKFVPLTFGYRW